MSRFTSSPFHKPTPFHFPSLPLSPPDTSTDIPPAVQHPSINNPSDSRFHSAPLSTASPEQPAAARPRKVSSIHYNSSPLRDPRERSSQRPHRSLVIVIPPSSLIQHHGQLGHTLSTGPHHRLSQGVMMPLLPSMYAQLTAIAREFNFPSIVGLCLYLQLIEGGVTTTPRIPDDSWQLLWSHIFDSPSSPTNGPFIAGRLEFDIDIQHARWYPSWIASLHREPVDDLYSGFPFTAPAGVHVRHESRPSQRDEDGATDNTYQSRFGHTSRHVPRKLSLVERFDSRSDIRAPSRPASSPEDQVPAAAPHALSPIFQEEEPKSARHELDQKIFSWRNSAISKPTPLAKMGQLSLEPANMPNDLPTLGNESASGDDFNLDDFGWSVTSLGPQDYDIVSVLEWEHPDSVHLADRLRGSVCLSPSICTSFGPSDRPLSPLASSISRLPSPDIAYRMYEDRPLTPDTCTSWGPQSPISLVESYSYVPSVGVHERMTFSRPVTPMSATSWGPSDRSWLSSESCIEYEPSVHLADRGPLSPSSDFSYVNRSDGINLHQSDWEHEAITVELANINWQHSWPYSRFSGPTFMDFCSVGNSHAVEISVPASYPRFDIYPVVYPHLIIYPTVAGDQALKAVDSRPSERDELVPLSAEVTISEDCKVTPWHSTRDSHTVEISVPTSYPRFDIYPAVYPHLIIYPAVDGDQALKAVDSRSPERDELVSLPAEVNISEDCKVTPWHSTRDSHTVDISVLTSYPRFEIYPAVYPHLIIYPAVPGDQALKVVNSRSPECNEFIPLFAEANITEDCKATPWHHSWPYKSRQNSVNISSRSWHPIKTSVSPSYPRFYIYPTVYPHLVIYPTIVGDNSVHYHEDIPSSAREIINEPNATTIWQHSWPYSRNLNHEIRATPSEPRFTIVTSVPTLYPRFNIYPTVYPHLLLYPEITGVVLEQDLAMHLNTQTHTKEICPNNDSSTPNGLSSKYPFLNIYPSVYPHFDLYPSLGQMSRLTLNTPASRGRSSRRSGYPNCNLYPSPTMERKLFNSSTPAFSGSYPYLNIYPAVYPHFDIYPGMVEVVSLKDSVCSTGTRLKDRTWNYGHYPYLNIYPAVYPHFDLYSNDIMADHEISYTSPHVTVSVVFNESIVYIRRYPYLDIYPAIYPFFVLYPRAAAEISSFNIAHADTSSTSGTLTSNIRELTSKTSRPKKSSRLTHSELHAMVMMEMLSNDSKKPGQPLSRQPPSPAHQHSASLSRESTLNPSKDPSDFEAEFSSLTSTSGMLPRRSHSLKMRASLYEQNLFEMITPSVYNESSGSTSGVTSSTSERNRDSRLHESKNYDSRQLTRFSQTPKRSNSIVNQRVKAFDSVADKALGETLNKFPMPPAHTKPKSLDKTKYPFV